MHYINGPALAYTHHKSTDKCRYKRLYSYNIKIDRFVDGRNYGGYHDSLWAVKGTAMNPLENVIPRTVQKQGKENCHFVNNSGINEIQKEENNKVLRMY